MKNNSAAKQVMTTHNQAYPSKKVSFLFYDEYLPQVVIAS